jgi:hypothetical protein
MAPEVTIAETAGAQQGRSAVAVPKEFISSTQLSQLNFQVEQKQDSSSQQQQHRQSLKSSRESTYHYVLDPFAHLITSTATESANFLQTYHHSSPLVTRNHHHQHIQYHSPYPTYTPAPPRRFSDTTNNSTASQNHDHYHVWAPRFSTLPTLTPMSQNSNSVIPKTAATYIPLLSSPSVETRQITNSRSLPRKFKFPSKPPSINPHSPNSPKFSACHEAAIHEHDSEQLDDANSTLKRETSTVSDTMATGNNDASSPRNQATEADSRYKFTTSTSHFAVVTFPRTLTDTSTKPAIIETMAIENPESSISTIMVPTSNSNTVLNGQSAAQSEVERASLVRDDNTHVPQPSLRQESSFSLSSFSTKIVSSPTLRHKSAQTSSSTTPTKRHHHLSLKLKKWLPEVFGGTKNHHHQQHQISKSSNSSSIIPSASPSISSKSLSIQTQSSPVLYTSSNGSLPRPCLSTNKLPFPIEVVEGNHQNGSLGRVGGEGGIGTTAYIYPPPEPYKKVTFSEDIKVTVVPRQTLFDKLCGVEWR